MAHFVDEAVLEEAFSAALAEAARTANAHPVASNHVTIEQIMSEANFKDLVYVTWRMSQLSPGKDQSSDRDALTYERVWLLFSSLGFGDIKRFRPIDSEDHFNDKKLCRFMAEHIVYIMREKQHACARCNCVVVDNRYGAIGFESDHISENYRGESEESRKTAKLDGARMGLLRALSEGAMTQLTCNPCHLNETHKNNRM